MNRTWVGGGNNEASNPNDWSPNGAPQSGDSLTDGVSGSTINIEGNALKGDVLSVAAQGVTLNLSHNADCSSTRRRERSSPVRNRMREICSFEFNVAY
jgi:hypothetical protein